MALYEVELTDGRTVQVEAPPGATDEQLSQIQGKYGNDVNETMHINLGSSSQDD